MDKRNKIIITSITILIFALIVLFVIISLKDKGITGSSDSNKIMKKFNEYYESEGSKIIYYASPSCGYCTLQSPILETLVKDYELDYYYLDSSKLSSSQRKEVLNKLKIDEHATPITTIVSNGEVIDSQIGYAPGNEYVEFLKKNEILPEDAVYSKEKYITFIDYNEYQKLISKDDLSIVVLGQTTCSHCIAIKPALNSVAGNNDLTIYYLNLTTMTEEENNKLRESLKTLEYSDPNFVEDGSFGTPTTLIIKNKKITNYISGEKTTSQLSREFKKLGLID